MRKFLPFIPLTVLAGLLVSCSISLGAGDNATQYFVIQERPYSGTPKEMIPFRLTVADTQANRFIDSHRILYSSNPAKRSYYQFASWIETPPEYFSMLLFRKIDEASLFNAVTRQSEGTSDYTLRSVILEFYHDTANPPGVVQSDIEITLVDLRTSKIVQKREFRRTTPVQSYDASGAVAASEQALNDTVDDAISWLSELRESKVIQ